MGTKPKTLQGSLKNGTPITASIPFFKMPYKQTAEVVRRSSITLEN
jgi:hypothetical protein